VTIPKKNLLTQTAINLFLVGALTACSSTPDIPDKEKPNSSGWKLPDTMEETCVKSDCSEVIILHSTLEAE